MRTYPFEVLWTAPREVGTLHDEVLEVLHPGLVRHVALSDNRHINQDFTRNQGHRHVWRNCDRIIRDWWKRHGAEVKTSHLLVMEHDVYCNHDLDLDVGSVSGVGGPRMNDPRRWSITARDIPLLPQEMQKDACRFIPLAVMLWHRDALDAIADSKWDGVFNADLYCEMRLPTVTRHCGFEVFPFPEFEKSRLAFNAQPPPGIPGFWHAVKEPVPAL